MRKMESRQKQQYKHNLLPIETCATDVTSPKGNRVSTVGDIDELTLKFLEPISVRKPSITKRKKFKKVSLDKQRVIQY